MVPADHPGQQRVMCVNISRTLGYGYAWNNLYEQFRKIKCPSYLIEGRQGVIDKSGSVMFSCGMYKGQEGGETRYPEALNWAYNCRDYLKRFDVSWNVFYHQIRNPDYPDIIANCSSTKLPAILHRKVFVMTALLDKNFHHLITDSLSRLPRYLDLLRRHPDIMIHFRNDSFDPHRLPSDKYAAIKSRDMLLNLLGLSPSRLIEGTVAADIVYIPRAMHISNSLKNPAEVRLLAKELRIGAKKEFDLYRKISRPPNFKPVHAITESSYNSSRKNIIILARLKLKGGDHRTWGSRDWDKEQTKLVIEAFQRAFPSHNVICHDSEAIQNDNFCMGCEFMEMKNAEVLVGLHGAGLTKNIFMPPGGLLVELSPSYNDAQMPLCGYYGNMAFMNGLHHYIYAYNFNEPETEPVQILNMTDVILQVTEFYQFVNFGDGNLIIRSYDFSSR